MKRYILFFIMVPLLIVQASDIHAWHSMAFLGFIGDHTHKRITKDADGTNDCSRISSSEYPDIYHYQGYLEYGSNTECHNSSATITGNNDELNGGFPRAWWESGKKLDSDNETWIPDNAISYYKSHDFVDAYANIGKVCHLIQDQSVPAHAANILHGVKKSQLDIGDDLETAADSHYQPDSASPVTIYSLPYKYYQPLQTVTRQKLDSWLVPGTTQCYWYPALDAPSSDADATQGSRGHYGGFMGTGTPGMNEGDIYNYNLSPDIVSSQLADAISYTIGALMSASESLPPLVSNLQMSAKPDDLPIISTYTPIQISFFVQENRKPNVDVFITIDSQNGENGTPITNGTPIIDAHYASNIGSATVLSTVADDYTWSHLPYESTFTFTWNGRFADGSCLSEGQHTLFVQVRDADKNYSDAITQKIIFSSNPGPIIDHHAIRDAVAGISLIVTSTFTCISPLDGPAKLYYRPANNGYIYTEADFHTIQNSTGAVIPGSDISLERGIEYFIYAKDIHGKVMTFPYDLVLPDPNQPDMYTSTACKVGVIHQASNGGRVVSGGDGSVSNDPTLVQFALYYSQIPTKNVKLQIYSATDDWNYLGGDQSLALYYEYSPVCVSTAYAVSWGDNEIASNYIYVLRNCDTSKVLCEGRIQLVSPMNITKIDASSSWSDGTNCHLSINSNSLTNNVCVYSKMNNAINLYDCVVATPTQTPGKFTATLPGNDITKFAAGAYQSFSGVDGLVGFSDVSPSLAPQVMSLNKKNETVFNQRPVKIAVDVTDPLGPNNPGVSWVKLHWKWSNQSWTSANNLIQMNIDDPNYSTVYSTYIPNTGNAKNVSINYYIETQDLDGNTAVSPYAFSAKGKTYDISVVADTVAPRMSDYFMPQTTTGEAILPVNMTINFDENDTMDMSSLNNTNITLMYQDPQSGQQTSFLIPSSAIVASSMTVKLNSLDLLPSTTYTLTLNRGIEDFSQIPLDKAYQIIFKTTNLSRPSMTRLKSDSIFNMLSSSMAFSCDISVDVSSISVILINAENNQETTVISMSSPTITLTSDPSDPTRHPFHWEYSWNGKDVNGNCLPEGQYKYRFQAVDKIHGLIGNSDEQYFQYKMVFTANLQYQKYLYGERDIPIDCQCVPNYDQMLYVDYNYSDIYLSRTRYRVFLQDSSENYIGPEGLRLIEGWNGTDLIGVHANQQCTLSNCSNKGTGDWVKINYSRQYIQPTDPTRYFQNSVITDIVKLKRGDTLVCPFTRVLLASPDDPDEPSFRCNKYGGVTLDPIERKVTGNQVNFPKLMKPTTGQDYDDNPEIETKLLYCIDGTNENYVEGLITATDISPDVKPFVYDITPPSAPIDILADSLNPSPWKNINTYTVSWMQHNDFSGIPSAYYTLNSSPTSKDDGVCVDVSSRSFTGTFNNLHEGYNTLYVWLKDGAGNASYVNFSTVTLRYDITPPVVSNYTCDAFSPNRDGIKESTYIWYRLYDNLSSRIKTRLEIYGVYSSTPVKTISNDWGALGDNCAVWDGVGDNGSIVVDGIYTCKITAYDEAGNSSTSTGTITVDTTPPEIKEPPVITPKIFALSDSTATISFNLTEALSHQVKVTATWVAIDSSTQFENTAIYFTTPSATIPNLLTYIWDGRDNYGVYITSGIYYIYLRAEDEVGNASSIKAGQIEVDRKPPDISNFYATPIKFSDGENVSINYNLDKQSTVSIEILDKFDRQIRFISSDHLSGTAYVTHEYPWDGKNNNGDPVSDGFYIIKLNATDQVGNSSYKKTSVIKNRIPAEISFPKDGAIVSNITLIRGDAQDPGIDNPTDFKDYRLWWRVGQVTDWSIGGENDPLQPSTTIWQEISVPYINQSPGDALFPNAYISSRSVTNDDILGYFNTTSLPPGTTCTILLVTEDYSNHSSYDSKTVIIQSSHDTTSPDVSITSPNQNATFEINQEGFALPIQYNLEQYGSPPCVAIGIFKMDGAKYSRVMWYKDNASDPAIWNGKNYAGNLVDTGDYVIRVTAYNSDGFGMSSVEATIHIDNTLGEPIKINKFNSSQNTLAHSDVAVITYQTSKSGAISISATNILTGQTTGLISNQSVNDKTDYTLIWPPYAGSVADGEYIFTITAQSINPDSTDYATLYITEGMLNNQQNVIAINSPTNGAIVQGEPGFLWKASASGKRYIDQSFNATVRANATRYWTEYSTKTFNWTVVGAATETYKTPEKFIDDPLTQAIQNTGSISNFSHSSGGPGSDTRDIDIPLPENVLPLVKYQTLNEDGDRASVQYFPYRDKLHVHAKIDWDWNHGGNYNGSYLVTGKKLISGATSYCPLSFTGKDNGDSTYFDQLQYETYTTSLPAPYGTILRDYDYTITNMRDASIESINIVNNELVVTVKALERGLYPGGNFDDTYGYYNFLGPGNIQIQFVLYLARPYIQDVNTQSEVKTDPPVTSPNTIAILQDKDNPDRYQYISPFSAVPQTKNQGTIGAVTYTVTCDNPDVEATWENVSGVTWIKARVIKNATLDMSCSWSSTTTVQGQCSKPQPFIYSDLSQLFQLPGDVKIRSDNPYSVDSWDNSSVVIPQPTSDGKYYSLTAQTSANIPWTSTEDPLLSGTTGYIIGFGSVFNSDLSNPTNFRLQSDIIPFASGYLPNYSSIHDVKSAFWRGSSKELEDNPYVDIDGNSWNVALACSDGSSNDFLTAIYPYGQIPNSDTDHNFIVGISTGDCYPKEYLEIKGYISPAGNDSSDCFRAYSLSYQKVGDVWKNIPVLPRIDNIPNSTLAYWDVTGLNGTYNIQLVAQYDNSIYQASSTITIGTKVPATATTVSYVHSPFNKAYLALSTGCVNSDTYITITPKRLSDSNIKLDPSMPMPIGEVYDLQPNGLHLNNICNLVMQFPEGSINEAELRKATIYHVKEDGTIEPYAVRVSTGLKAQYWSPVYNQWFTYQQLICPISSFSKFVVIPQIPPPILASINMTTNQSSITISGIAEKGSDVEIYNSGNLVTQVKTDDNTGTFELPIQLSEGVNLIKARVVRWFEQDFSASDYSTSTVRIMLDTTPPEIDNLSVAPQVLAPTGDPASSVVQISYTLKEQAYMSAKIVNSSSQTIKVLQSDALNPVGQNTLNWDGYDRHGNVVPPGIYTCSIKSKDMLGNESLWTGATIQICVPQNMTASSMNIIYPTNNSVVRDTVTVIASVNDIYRVSYVNFYIDGLLVSTATGSTYSYNWNTQNYPEQSTHTISAIAFDMAGNLFPVQSVNVTKSGAAFYWTIIATGTQGTGLPWSGQETGYVTVSAADGNKLVYTSALLAPNNDTVWSIQGSTEIINAWMQGNQLYAKIANLAPPVITINSPTNRSLLRGIVQVSATATDSQQVTQMQLFIDGNSTYTATGTGQLTWNWDTTIQVDGKHTLKILSLDQSGNVSSRDIRVVVDNHPPAITLSSPQSGLTYNASLRDMLPVSYSVYDTIDSTPVVNAYLIDLQGQTTIYTQNGDLVNVGDRLHAGTWKFIVSANDSAGNYSSVLSTVNVIVDALPPRTTITSVGSYGTNPMYVSINSSLIFSAVDDCQTINDGLGIGISSTVYQLDNGIWQTYTSPISFSTIGAHQVSFYSVDKLGKSENPHTVSLQVVPNSQVAPSSITISGLPDYPDNLNIIHRTVLVSADAVASAGNLITHMVFYVDGMPRWTAVTPPFVFPWDTADVVDGDHVVRVVAYDFNGNAAQDTRYVTVDNTGPSNSCSVSGTKYDFNGYSYITNSTLFSVSAAEAGCIQKTLFSDTFSSTTANWHQEWGYGSTFIDAPNQILYNEATKIRTIDGIAFPADRIVQVRTRTLTSLSSNDWDVGWIYAKYDSWQNSLYAVLHTTGDLEVEITEDGHVSRYDLATTLNPFDWHTFTFNIQGKGVTISIDGMAYPTIYDEKIARIAGGVALEGHNAHVQYSNVSVQNSNAYNVSGLDRKETSIDGAGYTEYMYPMHLANSGPHTFKYRGVDKAGNGGIPNEINAVVDMTPPETSFTVYGSSFVLGNDIYAADKSSVTIVADDPGYSASTFFENFISSFTNSFVANRGHWIVDNIAGNYIGSMSTDTTRALSAQTFASDRIVQVAMRTILGAAQTWNTGWLYPKYDSDDNNIYTLLHSTGDLELDLVIDGKSTRYNIQTNLNPSEWHTFRTEINQNNLKLFVDNQKYFDVNDLKIGLVDGRVAFESCQSEVAFSSVSVVEMHGVPGSGVKSLLANVDNTGFSEYVSTIALCNEGKHIVQIKAIDNVGNETDQSCTINIDTTPPVSQMVIGGMNYLSNGIIYMGHGSAISIVAQDTGTILSGIKGTGYRISNGDWQVYTSSFTLAESTSTTYSIDYYSTDNVGNTETTKTMLVQYDLTPPLAPVVNSIKKASNKDEAILISGQAEPFATVVPEVRLSTYTWEQAAIVADSNGAFSTNANLLGGLNGDIFRISAYAIDRAGNKGPESQEQLVTKDFAAPQITIRSPNAGYKYLTNLSTTTSFVVDYSVTDNLDPALQYTAYFQNLCTGATIYAVSGSTLTPESFGTGRWALNISATDWTGNYSSATTGSFTIVFDTVPPAPPILSSMPSASRHDDTIVFTGQTEPLATVVPVVRLSTYTWEQASVVADSSGTFSASANVFGGSNGDLFKISAYAIDRAGNKGAETLEQNIVKDFTAPQISFLTPVGGEHYITNLTTASFVNISFMVTDNLDPTPQPVAYIQNLVTGTTMYVLNGSSISVSAMGTGTWCLDVKATDWAGNISTATTGSFSVVFDTIPPQAPVLDQIKQFSNHDESIVIKGIAEPFATVMPVVKLSSETWEQTPVVADSSGVFSGIVNVNGGQDGAQFRITAYAISTAGNKGAFAPEQIIVKDFTPPTAPTVATLKPASNSNETIIVTGQAEPFATVVPVVKLGANAWEQTSVIADSSGTFSSIANLFGGSNGDHFRIDVYAIDRAGNKGAESTEQTIVKDLIAPQIVLVSPCGGEHYLTNITTTSFVNVNFIVTDLDPVPQTIICFCNLVTGATVYTVNGSTVSLSVLGTGTWYLNIKATDWAGNVSTAATGAFSVVFDTIAPQAPALDAVKQFSNCDEAITVKGITEPLATVVPVVELGSNVWEQAPVVADSSGTFSGMVNVNGGQDGTQFKITAYAIDTAGNKGASAQEQTVTKDFTPPAPPVLGYIPPASHHDETIVVSGQTEPFARVVPVVKMYDWGYWEQTEVVADSSGTFVGHASINGGWEGAEYRICAFSIDRAGNRGALSQEAVIVKDFVAPQITISSPKSGDRFVTNLTSSCTFVVNYSVTDNRDPSLHYAAYFKNLTTGTTIYALSGSTLTPANFGTGSWSLDIAATDWAGNYSSATTGSFQVVFDTIAPSAPAVNALKTASNCDEAITVSGLTEPFATVIPVVKMYDWGYWEQTPVTADASGMFSGTARINGGWNGAEYRISAYVIDQAGNKGPESIDQYIVKDFISPVSTLSIAGKWSGVGSEFDAFGIHYISPSTRVGLSASDTISGVNMVKYKISDINDWQVYTDSFTVAQGTHTIQYYSIDKAGNSEAAWGYNVFVTPIADYSVVGFDNVTIDTLATVKSGVRSNNTVTINDHASITGDVYANSVVIASTASISGSLVANAVQVSSASIDLVYVSSCVSFSNNNSSIPYTCSNNNPLDGNLKFSVCNDSITLPAGTYYFKEINISSGSYVGISGNVNIFCHGNISITGNSGVNYTNKASGLVIFADSGTVSVTGSKLGAIVYAPQSGISIDQNSVALGGYFGQTAYIAGKVLFEPPQQSTGTSMGAIAFRRKVAGADPEFKQGDIYAYPNPAKDGKAPVIHVECGIADSVEIKVYNIAAENVCSTTLSAGNPKTVNGKYCYEFEWNTSGIASGVYIYMVKANKKGYPEIKVIKKLAIIR